MVDQNENLGSRMKLKSRSRLRSLVNQFIMIIGIMLWVAAFCAGYFIYQDAVELRSLSNIRVEREQNIPTMPKIYEHLVAKDLLSEFVKDMRQSQKDVSFKVLEDGIIEISSDKSAKLETYSDAVLKLSYLNPEWKTDVISMCIGKECLEKQGDFYYSILKFSYLDVQ